MFPVTRTFDAVMTPLALKINEPLLLVIDLSSILNPAMSAFENVACPAAVIIANLVPAEGNDKELAETPASIVTSLDIVPPSNLKFEPVICPFDFNTNSPLELDIAVSLTLNPPIDAEVNLAAPVDDILAEASSVVEAAAGTNIELADKLLLITAPPPMVKLPSAFR